MKYIFKTYQDRYQEDRKKSSKIQKDKLKKRHIKAEFSAMCNAVFNLIEKISQVKIQLFEKTNKIINTH